MFKKVLLVIAAICTIHCNRDTHQISNKNLWNPSDLLKSLKSSPFCLLEIARNRNLRTLTHETAAIVGKYHPTSLRLFIDANQFSSVHKSLARVERLKWANRIQREGKKLFRNLVAKLNPVQKQVQEIIRLQNNKSGSRCTSRLINFIDLVLRLPSLIVQFVVKISVGYSNLMTTTTKEDKWEPTSQRTTTEKTTSMKPETTKALTKKTTSKTSTPIATTFSTLSTTVRTTSITTIDMTTTMASTIVSSTTSPAVPEATQTTTTAAPPNSDETSSGEADDGLIKDSSEKMKEGDDPIKKKIKPSRRCKLLRAPISTKSTTKCL